MTYSREALQAVYRYANMVSSDTKQLTRNEIARALKESIEAPTSTVQTLTESIYKKFQVENFSGAIAEQDVVSDYDRILGKLHKAIESATTVDQLQMVKGYAKDAMEKIRTTFDKNGTGGSNQLLDAQHEISRMLSDRFSQLGNRELTNEFAPLVAAAGGMAARAAAGALGAGRVATTAAGIGGRVAGNALGNAGNAIIKNANQPDEMEESSEQFRVADKDDFTKYEQKLRTIANAKVHPRNINRFMADASSTLKNNPKSLWSSLISSLVSHYKNASVNEAAIARIVGLNSSRLNENSTNPMYDLIARRIMARHVDLLRSYGLDTILSAIEDVSSHYDGDEIGTSDVSNAVREVIRNLEMNKE